MLERINSPILSSMSISLELNFTLQMPALTFFIGEVQQPLGIVGIPRGVRVVVVLRNPGASVRCVSVSCLRDQTAHP